MEQLLVVYQENTLITMIIKNGASNLEVCMWIIQLEPGQVMPYGEQLVKGLTILTIGIGVLGTISTIGTTN